MNLYYYGKLFKVTRKLQSYIEVLTWDFTNAKLVLKVKIKDIAKSKGIPAQQVQQQYLLEEILKAIARSAYKDAFILKGGYLIGQIIGLDKRTTMDLDVTLKGIRLDINTLVAIFRKIVNLADSPFLFNVEFAESIRGEDRYGGVRLKNICFIWTFYESMYLSILQLMMLLHQAK